MIVDSVSIPKIIHYVWLGRGELGALEKKCIASWREKLPDYEIKFWNEDSFDISSNQYLSEAYQAGYYAFASDYIRMWAVYNYGGIYLDTDTEVVKSFDPLLVHKAVFGFEIANYLNCGVLMARPKHPFFKKLFDSYASRSFYKADGEFDLYTSPMLVTDSLQKEYPHIRLDNTEQDLGDVHIYTIEHLCAVDCWRRKLLVTENTYCIHHYRGSWTEDLYEPCTVEGNDGFQKIFRKIYWKRKLYKLKKYFKKAYWKKKTDRLKRFKQKAYWKKKVQKLKK